MELVWDRGTLLIRDASCPASLPGVLWDPRVAAWRAPAHVHADLLAASATGTPVVDRARQPAGELPGFAVPELRPYQEAALAAWEIAGRRGVIALPTGAGKTRTAIVAIARTRVCALCLVPTRVLLEQWVAALKAAGLRDVGRFGDGERHLAPVTIATYASALRHADALGNRFDLLVVDEAHHFGGGAGDECLEMSIARFRLGLSATPVDDERRRERCESLIGSVVFRSAIEDLAGRFLAPFQLLTLSLPLDAYERRAYDREVAAYRPAVRRFFEAAPGADWNDFVANASRTEDGRRAMAAWRRARSMLAFTRAKQRAVSELLARNVRSRMLLFAADTATAYAIARTHLVPALTCDIGRSERADLLARFAQGELRVLVSARVLNEGVDVPEADVAILVGGTQGKREFVQRVGQVLRPAQGKQAVVFELVSRGTHEVQEADRRRRGLAAD
ncbi:MAG: DEAD/DEAH box helicase [Deltaproteobacteria bacterium]|nr:DEAD/DEAH box helicase [Deltaproteobacteria bacterium]